MRLDRLVGEGRAPRHEQRHVLLLGTILRAGVLLLLVLLLSIHGPSKPCMPCEASRGARAWQHAHGQPMRLGLADTNAYHRLG